MKKIGEWTCYNETEYELLKELDFANFSRKGYVYVLEYGNKIKIGTTKEPFKRLKSLKSMAENYLDTFTGRLLISKAHYNRFENEKVLHNMFSDSKIGNGELFSASFNEAIKKVVESKIEYVLEDTESTASIDDIIRKFLGDRDYLPKSNGRPRFICFSEKFEFIMFSAGIFSDDKNKEIYSEIENYINQFFDYDNYRDLYERELGHSEFNIIDACERFQDLRKLADDYLDRIEEVIQREQAGGV